jgi:hypothetical protein
MILPGCTAHYDDHKNVQLGFYVRFFVASNETASLEHARRRRVARDSVDSRGLDNRNLLILCV